MRPSLRLFLAIIITAVATVPVLFLGYWVEKTAMEKELAAVTEKHLLLARNMGAALERYDRDVKAVFRTLTMNMVLGTQLTGTQEMLSNLNFRHICVATIENGTVVYSLNEEVAPCPQRVPPKRFEIFKEIASKDEIRFTEVLPGPNGQPLLYLVWTVDDLLAIGAIKTDYIVELGKAISFGKRGHSAIVDHKGKILAHPLPKWRQAMKDISAVAPVKRMLNRETGVSTFYSPALKGDMVAGFTWVPGPNWGVMVPQPMDELNERAGDVRRIALSLIVIGLVVAAIISWYLSGLLVRPVRAVVSAASEIARGSFDARISEQSGLAPKEFHELGTAFNTMAQDIGVLITDRERAEAKLRTSHDQLELRVEGRTQELSKEITERTRSEDALRESEQRFRALFHQSPLGISVEDYSEVKRLVDRLKGEGVDDFLAYFRNKKGVLEEAINSIRLVDVNDKQIEMFGTVSHEEYKKYELNNRERGDDAWRSFHLHEISAFASGDITFLGETSDLLADGKSIEVRCVSRIIDSADKDWSEVVSTHEDITERKRVETELLESEQRNRNFAADVAHELRTPLAIFRSHLDNLPDSTGSENLRHEVDGMARLVEQLLALARLDAKNVRLSEEVNLHAICVDVAAHLAPVAVRAGRSIEVVGSDGPVNVPGIPAALEMAVRNLVENAIKYSYPSTTITIEISDDAIVRVIDNGPGIPMAIRKTVFDRFIRADQRERGSGLGLAIVRSVVQAHNGSVEIDDNPDGGTVISISLPSMQSPVAAVS